MFPTSSILPAFLLASTLIWIDVPFVAQSEKGCGAASTSMVMQYWDANGYSVPDQIADPSRIMQQLYSEKMQGIVNQDLVTYFRKANFETFSFAGTWQDLEHHIVKGRPLIVALEAEGKPGRLHYVVLTGIDSENHVLLVNDPSERKMMKMQRDHFEKRWMYSTNWTLLALPKK
jgi:predicted double-glycine peptidase